MQSTQSRRRFLSMLASAGAGSVIGARGSSAQERPPETTTIRLAKSAGICWAPQYVADQLLRAEGFIDVQYVWREPAGVPGALGRGEVDFSLHFSPHSILTIDAGERLTLVGGVHVGCFELFGHEGIRSIRDLKGKKVGVQAVGLAPHAFVTSMAAYVGLDPAKDIDWVLSPSVEPMELFAEQKIDAFLGTPPEPQELRARKIGRVRWLRRARSSIAALPRATTMRCRRCKKSRTTNGASMIPTTRFASTRCGCVTRA